MFDLWVQEIKTGKCWRLDHDKTKPVYMDENGQTDFEQMNIFDFLKGD